MSTRRARPLIPVLRGVLAAAGAAFVVAASASAQSWSSEWSSSPAARGWIGVSFQVDSDRWGRTSTVMITDVSPGSPASDAGVRPGDRLLAINEFTSPTDLGNLTDRLHLSPGDRVVMEVERAGERLRLRLTAAQRPDDVDIGRRVEVVLSNDAQVETCVRSMDSLRVELVQGGKGTIRIRRSGDADGQVAVLSRLGEAPSVRAPFEFFVFRGEAHDSLRREMVELNRLTADLEADLEQRERIVRQRTLSADPIHLAEDEQFQEISARLDDAVRRSSELSAAMAESARESAGLEYSVGFPAPATRVSSAGAVVADVPDPERAAGEFRPLTPYLLGRNRVAGAEVVEVRPELAEYFAVDGGVLVVDVADGTPAALAGVVPGDVIVRIDRVAVRSVEDLRFGVSMVGDSLPVTIVRRGETVQVTLRR
jgi:membrane-associated protease RseP (regulator of RpoE activity)